MTASLKAANLVVAFVLELGALVAVGYWGWQKGGSVGAQLAFAVILVALIATLWGLFAAPRSRFDLPWGGVLAVKVLVFAVATLAWWDSGLPVLAVVFAILVAGNLTLLTVWDQRAEVLANRQGPGH